jgi:phosphoenolpyruvate---glycerone phosphotransferase subunit DhaK
MKKLINRPDEVVDEALQGMACAYPHLLRIYFDPTYVVRIDAPVSGKVAVISGGGSGHEPMHCGYVGKGMLDAACPGNIFTSPVPDQVLAAMRAVDGGAGVLQIVKNYTGDIMNFELAAELAAAEGIEVARVVIDDDVAVENSLYTAGRRGVGTTVFAEKICGAAAEEGQPLGHVAALGRQVKEQGRSMGMALTSCTIPAVGKPTFTLDEDDMEMGIGIHGEPGRARVKLTAADEIAEELVVTVIEDLPFRRGDRVIALVNGMGGTPLMELYVVYRRLVAVCDKYGIAVARNLVGNYITSLEMAGCSVTLLRVGDDLLRLWDAPVRTPALYW